MTGMKSAVLLALCCAAPGFAQSGGMIPRWEVVEIAQTLLKHVENATAVLDGVRPKEWIQDGASTAYADQYDTLVADLANLRLSSEALERDPEKLTVVVDTFLWLDRTHSMMRSITDGARRYQNSSIADLLDSADGRHTAAIEQLKEYMQQLAEDTQHRMEVADAEAQRCRAELVGGAGR